MNAVTASISNNMAQMTGISQQKKKLASSIANSLKDFMNFCRVFTDVK